MTKQKHYPIDKLMSPIQKFMRREKSGSIVLVISVVVAILLANSPWVETYYHILEYKIGFQFGGKSYLEYDLLHWINDGLMAIFFFSVGLELKREFVGGELANPRKALLPIVAAIGGMVVPAVIYLMFNTKHAVQSGWGIPMATDIAFSLGVLYMLGKKVPFGLKIFLTALAVVDDLGAVVVIAFFYTSDISMFNLAVGLGCALIMFIGNKAGVRSIFFYTILGIAGVWLAFLLSGVHATIAAVIAAFTIPADVRLKEDEYLNKIKQYLHKLKEIEPKENAPTIHDEQLILLEAVKRNTNRAIPPLQRLSHVLHPFVTFVVLPIFALANAGVSLGSDFDKLFDTNVALGVAAGLLFGKVTGVFGATWLSVKLKLAPIPTGMNAKNLFGLSFLAAIGFTMSLFVTSLAFPDNPEFAVQAKIGIFIASILGAVIGYVILNRASRRNVACPNIVG